MNTLDPPHWILISYFGVFCTIWVHSGLFGCLTKLRAKRAEVGQKFVPRSRVEIFCNERTRLTLLGPKLVFCVCCSIRMHSGPFNCLTKLSAKWAELVQMFMPRSRVRIFRNKHIPIDPVGTKTHVRCISYYLGAFGTVWLPYKTWYKTSRSGAKVCAMKSWRKFSQ